MRVETALKLGCSAYEKSIKSPLESRIIKTASNNIKMTGDGKFSVIQRGRFIGLPFFKVSLEERKTCPKTCQQWDRCYGNNMPFAHRIDHTDPDFFRVLHSELTMLDAKHPHGFVVRLHELGDFYSVQYARFWLKALNEFSRLRIIGFTARPMDSKIGQVVEEMNSNTRKCYIRFSGFRGDRGAVVDAKGKDVFQCPSYSHGLTCAQCTLCWETQKCVSFKAH